MLENLRQQHFTRVVQTESNNEILMYNDSNILQSPSRKIDYRRFAPNSSGSKLTFAVDWYWADVIAVSDHLLGLDDKHQCWCGL